MADDFIPEEDKSIIKETLDLGSDFGGSVTGAVIGLVVAGPKGALAGAAVGPVVKKSLQTLADVCRRKLSWGENKRIAIGAEAAIFQIDYRLCAGYEPRNDGFFDGDELESRSPAAELFEGALLKCRDSYQEKKIKFLANIFATTAFDPTMSAAEANYVLRLAESLTYRQLCFLGVIKRRKEWELMNRVHGASFFEPILEDYSALHELHALCNAGLMYSSDSEVSNSTDATDAIMDTEQITPARLFLSVFGKRFHDSLDLRQLEDVDITRTVSLLQGK